MGGIGEGIVLPNLIDAVEGLDVARARDLPHVRRPNVR